MGSQDQYPPTKPGMAPASQATVSARRGAKMSRAHHLSRFVSACLGLGFAALAIGAVLIGAMVTSGKAVDLPDWAVDRLETRINEELSAIDARLEIGDAGVGLSGDVPGPTVRLRDVTLLDGTGAAVLSLPEMETRLDTTQALQGKVAPETLTLRGAEIQLRREEDGTLTLGIGQLMTSRDGPRSLDELFARIDAVFEEPLLREFEAFRSAALNLRFFDARSGRQMALENGDLRLVREDGRTNATLNLSLAMNAQATSHVHLALDKAPGVSGARVVAKFSDLPARQLASQVSALSFLSILEANSSGALTAQINGDGYLESLAGALSLGAGALKPEGQARPLPFESAHAYLRYDLESSRLLFDEIQITAEQLQLAGTGHLDLLAFQNRVPQTLVGQLRFSDVKLTLDERFDAPVRVDRAALDLRYDAATARLDIGQLLLDFPDARLLANGFVRVDDAGWQAELNADVADISPDTLLALWPKGTKVKTRAWLTKNVETAQISDVRAALRLSQGQPSRHAVNFNFTDATVFYLRRMPPVSKGRGYGVIEGNRFLLNLYSGEVQPREGTPLDVSGSVLEIADMTVKPATLDVDLQVQGPLLSTLSLLDTPPLEFLKKSNLNPQIATGAARAHVQLQVPLKPKVNPREVRMEARAELRDVRSDVLVQNRVLEAGGLTLMANNDELRIGGPGRLDGVPVDATWARPLGQGGGARSQVQGEVRLTAEGLEAFGVRLPPGSVTGEGTAEVKIDLVAGAPPELQLRSDLTGLRLRIAPLDWSKRAETEGDLDLSMTLGAEPKVTALAITAPGLEATGEVFLREGGGLDRAVFSPLKVDGRLNSRVSVQGRGPGAPVGLELRGGSLDIRRVSGGGTGPSGAGGGPLDAALDRLIISDGLALTDFRGKFRNAVGLNGDFRASLNGAAPVQGTVVPTANGPAVRIRARDAGAVLRASGLFANARGGALDLQLRPTGEAGTFRGTLKITNTRMVNAPAIASLLSAISVVGLLEQLGAEGIPFGNVEAEFILSPKGVTLLNSSAVGASMGISMDGVYNLRSKSMDMQGVISPIYAVNGIFGALFAPRRGEGLFGFNYTLRGTPDAPSVGVNPLSMLTPGIFRELFRQPPPQLEN